MSRSKKKTSNQKGHDRRSFMQMSAAAGMVGFWGGTGLRPGQLVHPGRSALEEIRFACIGVGGKGGSDSTNMGSIGKVVAICAIDEDKLNKKNLEFPDAKKFTDYRKLFDEMGDSIDAVSVSTPDHTHAVIALRALRMGKHVYCQKPLTHSIEEARMMREAAEATGVKTQMGNQGTALSNLRGSAALCRAGIVGAPKEIHVWTNRPVWPQSYGLKVKTAPGSDPEEMKAWEERKSKVHWQNWLGPATPEPYSPEIHPFKWRGFWKFGTGALGDMACHTLNMSFMAYDLFDPTSVEAVHDAHDGVCFPAKSKITFEFPASKDRGPVKMIWYDGGARPDADLFSDLPRIPPPPEKENGKSKHYTSAALIVGEKGKFYSPGDYGGVPRHTGVIMDGEFIRQSKITRPREDDGGDSPFSEFKDIEFTNSPGHVEELGEAIHGGADPVSNFPKYSGPLTESILLGNLSLMAGKKVEWDAKNMVATDVDEKTQKLIRHDYPDEYTIHEPAMAK